MNIEDQKFARDALKSLVAVSALATAFSAGVDVGELEGTRIAQRNFPSNTVGASAVTLIACGVLAVTSFTGRREDFNENSEPRS